MQLGGGLSLSLDPAFGSLGWEGMRSSGNSGLGWYLAFAVVVLRC